MKKILSSVLGCFLVLSTMNLIVETTSASPPLVQNQGQNKTQIRPGESIVLSSQARDDDGLTWAWLATDEEGPWKNFSGWWNYDWMYSKKISLTHSLIQADLVNFPVLLIIVSPDFISHAQPDGDDFAFVSQDNITRYDHEIEYYNSTSGELVAWVNIPLLSSTQDTILYIYYGNSTCSSQQDSQATWSNGFILVHHLTGSDYTVLTDSTSNHWNVTSKSGTPRYNRPGRAASCIEFYPQDDVDYLKISGFRLLQAGSYTGSAWVYLNATGTTQSIIEGDGSETLSLLQNPGTPLTFSARARTQTVLETCTGTTSLQPYKWYYVCTRVNAATTALDLFVDGGQDGHILMQSSVVSENTGLNIGVNTSENSPMDGKIDEIRISNVARSDAWILTEYLMMTAQSSFLTMGNELTPGISTTYGSPLHLQQTTTWQWSNFTWLNQDITEERQIYWRIYYQDTKNNIGCTNTMSFTLKEQPPSIPGKPEGVSSGITGTEYIFVTTGSTDPDNDDIAYWFDWGDDTASGWTEFKEPGVFSSASHVWQTPGTYQVKAKAQDIYNVESTWSTVKTVLITDSSQPLLTIQAPASVYETELFDVLVSAAGTPVQGAIVEFANNTYQTDSDGIAHLSAPLVTQDATLSILVRHTQYRTGSTSLIVRDRGDLSTTGWLYGVVYDTSGVVIEGVLITVQALNGQQSTTTTDDSGYYLLVPAGTYTVQASKEGYQTEIRSNIVVQTNTAVDVTFTMDKETLGTTPSQDLIEAVINLGISKNKVGGEIDCQLNNQWYNITIHETNLSVEVLSINQSVLSFTITAENTTKATIIAMRLYSEESLADITVVYDGMAIEQVNFSEIFSLQNNETAAKYTKVITTNETEQTAYCLVYIPHFSTHEITIYTIQETIRIIGGIIAIAMYVVIAFIVAFVFIYPVFSGTLLSRRRRKQ